MSLTADAHLFRSFSHAELEQSMADLALSDELNTSLLAYIARRKDMISLIARAYDEKHKDESGAFDICSANLTRSNDLRYYRCANALWILTFPGRCGWTASRYRFRARLYFEKTGKMGCQNDAVVARLMGFEAFKMGSLVQPLKCFIWTKASERILCTSLRRRSCFTTRCLF